MNKDACLKIKASIYFYHESVLVASQYFVNLVNTIYNNYKKISKKNLLKTEIF